MYAVAWAFHDRKGTRGHGIQWTALYTSTLPATPERPPNHLPTEEILERLKAKQEAELEEVKRKAAEEAEKMRRESGFTGPAQMEKTEEAHVTDKSLERDDEHKPAKNQAAMEEVPTPGKAVRLGACPQRSIPSAPSVPCWGTKCTFPSKYIGATSCLPPPPKNIDLNKGSGTWEYVSLCLFILETT